MRSKQVNKMVQQKYKQKRNCSVCGNEKSKLLFQQCFLTIPDVSIMDGYNIVVCQKCGFCFAENIPEQSVFDAYYREMSKYEYQQSGGQESEYDLARFYKISATIQQFISNKDWRILDVGCATGRLLSLLKENGYQNVLGLDPSSSCAEAAKRLYGIRVLTNTLSDISVSDQSFDFLILVGILEHIRDLGSALARVRRMLSDDGLIYIEVPDVAQFARWPNAPFQQFSIEHINFFSVTSLTNLMQLNGFGRVFCRQDAHKWSYKTMDPVISVIFKKNNLDFKFPVQDIETEQRLIEYIRCSKKVDNHIHRIINSIITNGNPIIVWGVGTYTLRLLATTKLSEANIRIFVDSNPKYQGKQLNGIPIIAPANLEGRSEPILISSYVFQKDIQRQIRDELKYTNKLILLY